MCSSSILHLTLQDYDSRAASAGKPPDHTHSCADHQVCTAHSTPHTTAHSSTSTSGCGGPRGARRFTGGSGAALQGNAIAVLARATPLTARLARTRRTRPLCPRLAPYVAAACRPRPRWISSNALCARRPRKQKFAPISPPAASRLGDADKVRQLRANTTEHIEESRHHSTARREKRAGCNAW